MLGDPEDLRTYCILSLRPDLETRMPSLTQLVCQNSILSYMNCPDSELPSLPVSHERFFNVSTSI
jgi:hypothetical protein